MYYDSLPYYVYLKNKKVIINADYHIFIEFEEEMQGKDIKSAVEKALTKFYPAFYLITENDLVNEAVEKFISIISFFVSIYFSINIIISIFYFFKRFKNMFCINF